MLVLKIEKEFGKLHMCNVTTLKMKNVYFQTHRSFYIIFSLKVLNRYQKFIHSVGWFKKPIYRYTNQAF